MSKYIVRISRTEQIDFAVEATDEADAENRYLLDGNEIDSRTMNLTVERVDLDLDS